MTARAMLIRNWGLSVMSWRSQWQVRSQARGSLRVREGRLVIFEVVFFHDRFGIVTPPREPDCNI